MEENKPDVCLENEEKVKTYDISTPSDKEGEPELLDRELTELRESVSRQEESIQSYVEQIRRLQADFENWRRRVEQEKVFLVENAGAVLLEKLLPILDSFERALQTPVKCETDQAFKEGMNLIFRQIYDLLKAEGLEPMESIGELFDPKRHEAYAYEERADGEDHLIIEEARKGYLFKGRVLRPALVKVLKVSKVEEKASGDGQVKRKDKSDHSGKHHKADS